jgi:Cu(I)/Ag(I) efflux system membrane fusion protein
MPYLCSNNDRMKTARCIALGVLSMALILGACHAGTSQEEAPQQDSIRVQWPKKLSDTLAIQMQQLMQDYYQLKEAFVQSDPSSADGAADRLGNDAKALAFEEFSQDSTRFSEAQSARKSILAELAGLKGESTLLGKRQEFQMISDILYDLIKATGLNNQTVYRDFCPMFNGGNGAYWLSSAAAIRNPYYGQDMLECGEISQTIQF